jgi:hypothetical protein
MTIRAWASFTVSVGLLLTTVSSAVAQEGGFGIGPRLTFVRGNGDSPDGAARFAGGAIRIGGGKTVLEIAMDFRSGVTGDLTERIRDYPIQGSLLLFPVRGRLAPYLLAGLGWYSQRVEHLATGQTIVDEATTRKIGYHAGFGGELRVQRHLGLYGDYRYTFIHFGDDLSPTVAVGSQTTREPVLPSWVPFAERLKMTHEGSMFTWGATFYF